MKDFRLKNDDKNYKSIKQINLTINVKVRSFSNYKILNIQILNE